jgi:hypothetical protein
MWREIEQQNTEAKRFHYMDIRARLVHIGSRYGYTEAQLIEMGILPPLTPSRSAEQAKIRDYQSTRSTRHREPGE